MRSRVLLLILPIFSCLTIASVCSAISTLRFHFNQVSGFRPMVDSPDTMIPDTRYRFAVYVDIFTDYTIVLWNEDTREKFVLGDAFSHPQYTTLRHRNNVYLIIKSVNLGTIGGYDYPILNVSGSVPREIGLAHACIDPSLNGDTLEFPGGRCEWFPFNFSDDYIEYVTLN